ncbi:hypothetical protein ACS0TY_033030 [Phlomoides rotata]
MEEVNLKTCKSMWANSKFEWSWHGAVGNSGGILTIWNSEVFQKTTSQRKVLWETIQALVWQNGTEVIGIIGDFNTIREESDMVGRSNQWDRNEMDRFNNFIEGCDLSEVQLVGRRFTWYRPDGTCNSKLDRLLVNTNWINKWTGQILRGGKRSLSDHVPIFIEGCKKDWGPRPFKFFNQWIQHPGYKELIEKVWSSSTKQGWASFVIKEKLKEVKIELKTWSNEIFHGLDRRIEVKNEEIERLDLIDDTFGLEDTETSRRQELLGDLMMESSWRESQLIQKLKLKWLSEGDANTSFFHNWIKCRQKKDEIMGLWSNNRWIESVQAVKKLVFEHFKNQFEKVEEKSAFFTDTLFQAKVDTTGNALLAARLSEQKEMRISGWGVGIMESGNKPKIGVAERWKWKHNKEGYYTVKKSYAVMVDKIERANAVEEED